MFQGAGRDAEQQSINESEYNMSKRLFRADGEQVSVIADGEYVRVEASDGDVFQFAVVGGEDAAMKVAEGVALVLGCAWGH